MTIDIGTATKSRLFVDKGFNVIAQGVNISPTSSLAKRTPVFVIDYNEALVNANYLYCPLFQRYYYIEDISLEIGKTMTLTCRADPAMSFLKDNYIYVVGLVMRASGLSATHFSDDKLPVDPVQKNYYSLYFYNESNYPLTAQSNNYVIDVICSDTAPYTPPAPEPEPEPEQNGGD